MFSTTKLNYKRRKHGNIRLCTSVACITDRVHREEERPPGYKTEASHGSRTSQPGHVQTAAAHLLHVPRTIDLPSQRYQ